MKSTFVRGVWYVSDRFFRGKQSWRHFPEVDSPDASLRRDIEIDEKVSRLVEAQDRGDFGQ
jgi:hypothetical protein